MRRTVPSRRPALLPRCRAPSHAATWASSTRTRPQLERGCSRAMRSCNGAWPKRIGASRSGLASSLMSNKAAALPRPSSRRAALSTSPARSPRLCACLHRTPLSWHVPTFLLSLISSSPSPAECTGARLHRYPNGCDRAASSRRQQAHLRAPAANAGAVVGPGPLGMHPQVSRMLATATYGYLYGHLLRALKLRLTISLSSVSLLGAQRSSR